MKIDTFIKLGSLAFGVVQDEKVQELFKMAHKGAKRRGFLTPPSFPEYDSQHPAPFRTQRPRQRTPFL